MLTISSISWVNFVFFVSLFELLHDSIAYFDLFLKCRHNHFSPIFVSFLQMLMISFAEAFILLWKYIILNKIYAEANTELFAIKGKQHFR
jgi:hypothetical protein